MGSLCSLGKLVGFIEGNCRYGEKSMLDMPFNQPWSELGSLISVGGILVRTVFGLKNR